VQAAVDCDVVEEEPDDLVVGRKCLGAELVEHAGDDPLVAPCPGRRVRHLLRAEMLSVLPTAPRHQAYEDHLEAVAVRGSRTMTAQGMGVEGNGQQRLTGSPDGIYHFGVERAHDEGDLHLVIGGWVKHPDCLGATTTTGGWSATG